MNAIICIRNMIECNNIVIRTKFDKNTVSIGTIMNLIINEELPQSLNWTNAIDYEIEENFQDLEFPIHETFSWYQGSDIKQRLELFKGISFSFEITLLTLVIRSCSTDLTFLI